ncbi:MAG: nickel pincer cofactor biosynthesis protein LarC [Desulfoplanes sp.]|nr:nickel pincer cofactor biosynthesis protein LarC [Desulfoplanes sp.]MDD4650446.1 nickel pincer cofactor biosynthesis protein LarC [Desulfoplanes sp.]
MNILYYDCFAGISGDMNLAAMIALGISPEYLQGELSKLGLDDEFSLKISEDTRKGIHGTRVDVILQGHHHTDDEHNHPHAHRTLRDIESRIQSCALSDAVKATSMSIFMLVAEAEAKIHGKDIYEVHFHEVGATDSIVDIVGAAICFHELHVDEVWCSSVELGGGFVSCAHGIMPVPAPATTEILTGCPTTRGAVNKETTTPTGGAILAVLTDRFTDSPRLTVTRTGYGIGHRDTAIPNLLRVHLARVEEHESGGWETRSARLLECNIDDMTPEALGVAMDVLLDAGAKDVHFTPVVMKKNRLATHVSLLCDVDEENRFKRLIFRHTTTLGIKSMAVDKSILARTFETLDTALGTVSMKNALMDGKVIRSKPELEDCRKIAQEHDISLAEVYQEIGRKRRS